MSSVTAVWLGKASSPTYGSQKSLVSILLPCLVLRCVLITRFVSRASGSLICSSANNSRVRPTDFGAGQNVAEMMADISR